MAVWQIICEDELLCSVGESLDLLRRSDLDSFTKIFQALNETWPGKLVALTHNIHSIQQSSYCISTQFFLLNSPTT